jgi:prepilin-type N-terminal cleavage/methylation domain-containing protein
LSRNEEKVGIRRSGIYRHIAAIRLSWSLIEKEGGMSACRKGFTLVELLIVILLIALLVALLLPTFGRVWEQARQVQCLSNMRQLTAAYIRYTHDYRDQLLPLDSATAQAGFAGNQNQTQVIPAIFHYTRESRVFHCPSDARDGMLSYSINDYLGGTWPSFNHAARITEIRGFAQVFAFIEEVDLNPKAGDNDGGFVVDPAPVWIDYPAVLHRNGTCITFMDGHGEFMQWSDPRTAQLTRHLTPSAGNPDLVTLQNMQGSISPH